MLWMLKTFDYNRFDMHFILKMAFEYNCCDLVEWIMINIDARMFDIELVIQSVTKRSNLSWMLEKFDHGLFDLQSIMTNACTCYMIIMN
jgi:hypothetical protein